MKKFIVVFLAILICIGSLAGCSAQGGKTSEPSAQTSTSSKAFNLTAKIEEQVIYDKDGVLIKATSLGTDSYEEEGRTFVKLNIHAENTGTTEEVTPVIYNISINGILINTYQGKFSLPSSAVSPKHYQRDDFYVIGYIEDGEGYYTALADAGIADVATIDFDLVLQDLNVFDDEIGLVHHVIDTTHVTIKTNIADSYKQTKPNPDGEVIYDQDGLRIVCLGLADPHKDEDWKQVRLFIENNSDKTFAIHSLPTQVNGTTLKSSGSTQLSPLEDFTPGTCAYTNIRLLKSLMTANGVTMSADLKSLTCCFEIRKVDYYTNDTLLSKTPEVTMKFD